MDIILIVAIILAVSLLAIAFILFLAKKKPESLAPVANKVAQTKTGKKQIAKTIGKQSPEELEKTLAESLGREQSRKVAKILAGKNEADRTKLVEQLLEGKKTLSSEDLYKSKSKDMGAAARKKKEKNRQKRKQAKKQRKKK